MGSNKKVLWFFVKFIISYSILLCLYPVVKDSFRDFLIIEGNFFFGSMDGGKVEVQFSNSNESKRDINVLIGNAERKTADNKITGPKTEFSSLFSAYLPFTFMLSLIIASPVSVMRRIKALTVGIIIINFIVLLKFLTQLYYAGNKVPELNVLTLSPGKLGVVNFLYMNITNTIPPTLLLVVLLWILLVFRKQDFPHSTKKNSIYKKV